MVTLILNAGPRLDPRMGLSNAVVSTSAATNLGVVNYNLGVVKTFELPVGTTITGVIPDRTIVLVKDNSLKISYTAGSTTIVFSRPVFVTPNGVSDDTAMVLEDLNELGENNLAGSFGPGFVPQPIAASIKIRLPTGATISLTHGTYSGIHLNQPAGSNGSTPIDITLDVTQTDIGPEGRVAGRFTSTDSDLNDSFTYGLFPGEGDSDNGLFKIVGDQLIVVGPLTKESNPVVSIRVRTTDSAGRFFEKKLTFEGTSEPNQTPSSTVIDSVDRPLHNRQSPFDVDQNGTVTPLDALLVINMISRNRRPVDARSSLADSTMKVDVNDDLQVSAIDALLVINEISRRAFIAAPVAEGESAVDAVFGSSGDLEEVTAKRKRQASGK